MEKGQILMGCSDYWEDSYISDAQWCASRGIATRPKKGSSTLWQCHVIHLPYFYKVIGLRGDFVVLQKLNKIEDYGGETTIYYDTPCQVTPSDEFEGDSFKRKLKSDENGEYVDIDTYIKARVWDGLSECQYNLH